jgi:hypothetical protein
MSLVKIGELPTLNILPSPWDGNDTRVGPSSRDNGEKVPEVLMRGCRSTDIM